MLLFSQAAGESCFSPKFTPHHDAKRALTLTCPEQVTQKPRAKVSPFPWWKDQRVCVYSLGRSALSNPASPSLNCSVYTLSSLGRLKNIHLIQVSPQPGLTLFLTIFPHQTWQPMPCCSELCPGYCAFLWSGSTYLLVLP